MIRLKHSKSNLYSAIANLDTIDNAVKSQLSKKSFDRDVSERMVRFVLANVRLTGVMQKSADIAQSLSALMQVEQLQGVSQQFSQELVKVSSSLMFEKLPLLIDRISIQMGIMDEMMTEIVDGAMNNPDLEEEADEEVDKILNEVLGSKNEILT